jgi:hypothetical protein
MAFSACVRVASSSSGALVARDHSLQRMRISPQRTKINLKQQFSDRHPVFPMPRLLASNSPVAWHLIVINFNTPAFEYPG